MRYALALLAVLSIILIATPTFAADEVLTNASITEMKSLGLGDDVIIGKIKTSNCKFDTSIPALKQLKDTKISDAVIQAMLLVMTPPAPVPAPSAAPAVAAVSGDPNDPKAAHTSGIYLYQEVGGKPKMTMMTPSRVQELESGSGWGMAWGGSMKSHAVLSGTQAGLQLTETQPVFYFYFDKKEASLGSVDASATSPDDFALGKMEEHKVHHEMVRRIEVSKASMGGYRVGLNKSAIHTFTSEKVSDGVFKVTAQDLQPGEYVFVQLLGVRMVSTLKMFDFGVGGGGGGVLDGDKAK